MKGGQFFSKLHMLHMLFQMAKLCVPGSVPVDSSAGYQCTFWPPLQRVTSELFPQ